MRKPKQVLVFLYRINKEKKYEYCIFRRKNMKIWQALSGGVEDNESLFETVKREVNEETSLIVYGIYQLSSKSTIPVVNIAGNFAWGDDVYVAMEYSFAVFVKNGDIILSDEHDDYGWFTYENAYKKLEFDSNRTALWELNKKLLNSTLL